MTRLETVEPGSNSRCLIFAIRKLEQSREGVEVERTQSSDLLRHLSFKQALNSSDHMGSTDHLTFALLP